MKPYIFSALTCAMAASLSAQALDYWDFATATDGDGLQDVANTGSLGTAWNFNTTAQGDVVTSGVFNVSGDETITRKATLASATALNTLGSSFRYELDVASWDLTNADVGTSVAFRVADSAAQNFAQIILEKDTATTARFRWSTELSDGSSFFRQEAVTLTGGPAVYAIEFELGGLVNYLSGATVVNTSTLNFGSSDIAESLFVKNNITTGTADAILSVNSFGLSAVPEPSTYALIGGLLALSYVMTRRRK